jgi:hypothetical protein
MELQVSFSDLDDDLISSAEDDEGCFSFSAGLY